MAREFRPLRCRRVIDCEAVLVTRDGDGLDMDLKALREWLPPDCLDAREDREGTVPVLEIEARLHRVIRERMRLPPGNWLLKCGDGTLRVKGDVEFRREYSLEGDGGADV